MKIKSLFFLVVFVLFSFSASAESMKANDLPTGSEKISLIELGSKKCTPCKKMKPILSAIKEQYEGQVKVVFHDIKTRQGRLVAKEYKIRIVPTQVFVDKEGNELDRHEGFFSKKEIIEVLNKNGVSS